MNKFKKKIIITIIYKEIIKDFCHNNRIIQNRCSTINSLFMVYSRLNNKVQNCSSKANHFYSFYLFKYVSLSKYIISNINMINSYYA